VSAAGRPHLLVLNQYYWPAYEATGHVLTELCEGLADPYEVVVVTGALGGRAPAGWAERSGVRILRVASTAYERRRLSLRALNYVTFVVFAALAGLRCRRADIVLCMTDPPFLGAVAHLVARRFDAPLVVIAQDVFPEIAVRLGRLRNPVVVGALRLLVGYSMTRADRVVAIGETMARRLEAKGVRRSRLRLIPNWTDTDALRPMPKANEWARENGLDDRFVVMHSGNVGHAQDLESLVRATTFLRDLDRLAVVVIGTGVRHADLRELADRLEADAVRFLDYQPRELLPLSLAAADLHVVGLARGLSGFIVPSRLYGVLAAGRPVIAAAEEDAETALTVREARCGVVVPPGRPELLAAAIRDAYEGRLDLEGMGRRAREWVVAEADRRVAVARYRELLAELAGERERGGR
jgi:colanic acid biosynthesis glycosyl transferase WcaI